MTSIRNEQLGLRRIVALHLFVRDLERAREHYLDKLGFTEVAVSTREFELEQRARASVVEAGGARLVLLEPLGSRGESFAWLERHPEGVARIVFDVEDVEHTFDVLMARGATSTSGIRRRDVDGSRVLWFDIPTAIGDTQFRFVELNGRMPLMPDLERIEGAASNNDCGIEGVDHITCNFLTLKPTTLWMQHVMGFEPYWEIAFHTQDVRKGQYSGSGLKSVVMYDPESGVKFALNEPAAPCFEASQVYLFCHDHRGPGVQHVAFSVPDIRASVRELKRRGVGFVRTPWAYYDALPKRLIESGIGQIDEPLDELRDLEILVDGNAEHGYLLQIFMKDAAAQFGDRMAGPLFIELIQRRGDRGFGAGNFRALFESIEREQQGAGRI